MCKSANTIGDSLGSDCHKIYNIGHCSLVLSCRILKLSKAIYATFYSFISHQLDWKFLGENSIITHFWIEKKSACK